VPPTSKTTLAKCVTLLPSSRQSYSQLYSVTSSSSLAHCALSATAAPVGPVQSTSTSTTAKQALVPHSLSNASSCLATLSVLSGQQRPLLEYPIVCDAIAGDTLPLHATREQLYVPTVLAHIMPALTMRQLGAAKLYPRPTCLSLQHQPVSCALTVLAASTAEGNILRLLGSVCSSGTTSIKSGSSCVIHRYMLLMLHAKPALTHSQVNV
jgi:hypothetical protein